MKSLKNIGWTGAGLMAFAAMAFGSSPALAQRSNHHQSQQQSARSSSSHRQSATTRSSSQHHARRPSASVSYGRSGQTQVRVGNSHASYGYARSHHSRSHSMPGRYVTQTRRVLVSSGRYQSRYCAPVYGNRYDAYGRRCRVVIQKACYKNVWVPARYENRQTRVWVPGHRTGWTSHRSGNRY
jgi:hypothetical protein